MEITRYKIVNFTLFKIGLLITMIGIGLSTYVFLEAEKISELFTLDITQTTSLEKYLKANDIGFFKIYMPNFKGDVIFVQILDPQGNIIADKKLETKMSINYFDIIQDGQYTIKSTNLSQNTIYFEVEFGQTNSQQLIYPGIIILIGITMIIVSAYKKLKNYSIAQPDENTS